MLSTAAFTFPALASSAETVAKEKLPPEFDRLPIPDVDEPPLLFRKCGGTNAAGFSGMAFTEPLADPPSTRLLFFEIPKLGYAPSFLGRHAASYNFSLSTCANNSPLYRQILNPLSTFNLGATVDVNNLLPHGDHSAVTEHAARQLPISLNFPSNKR
jgi:hypothetical protein